MNDGFEWADVLTAACGAEARDRKTGEQFFCKLRNGHTSEIHHWEEIRAGQVRHAAWIAVAGPWTPIGGDTETPT